MIREKLLCRVCKGKNLIPLWDFGPSPLANALLDSPDQMEEIFPLKTKHCKNCGNVQLSHVVDPEKLFSHYLYSSSASKSFIKHFEEFAEKMSFVKSVVDIGSNDGILLKPFQDKGIAVLGIEPATNLAKKASVPTINEFFTPKLARQIGRVGLVTCTNTFAHIDGLDSVVRGVKTLIGKTGLFVIEVQYLLDQVKKNYFDNVYHEHLQYWTVTTLQRFLKRHGLKILNVEHIDTHGGSLRAYVAARGPVDPSVGKFAVREKMLTYKRLYRAFLTARDCKVRTLQTLLRLKRRGKRIVGYGCPAKATTLCNFFGVGSDLLDYIVDDSPLKQGKYLPGKRIPIVSVKELYKSKPDYILILAWNFASVIKKNHPGFKYIVPRL